MNIEGITCSELMTTPWKELRDEEYKPKLAKFKKSNLTIKIWIGYWYEIDLKQCQSSTELMDWIFHIMGKQTKLIKPVMYDFLYEFETAFNIVFGEHYYPDTSCDKKWNWKKGILE